MGTKQKCWILFAKKWRKIIAENCWKVLAVYNIFLKEVLETADVVFYDECDRVQKNLDDLFTQATEFNAFIKECAEDYHQFMLESNAKRMENISSIF